MTVRDPALSDDNLTQAIQFVLERFKAQIHTQIPATVEKVVVTSDGVRVDAKPVVGLMIADGSTIARPVAVNVPVLWPGGGGWEMRFPLNVGDEVLLVFCERDITAWKETSATGVLPSDRMVGEQDTVAVPAFSTTMLTGGEVSISNSDGSTQIRLSNGLIELTATTVNVSGELQVNGVALTVP